MSVTDELIRNNENYARSFKKGDLAMPPSRRVAVLACMDARLDTHKILGLEEGEADVKQSIARIQASPFIPNKSSVRGFVYDVKTGRLNEVTAAERVH